jgi:hypothetical protein
MAALSGAAVDGATGGIIGGLLGPGIPEYEAKQYEGNVRAEHLDLHPYRGRQVPKKSSRSQARWTLAPVAR